MTVAESLSIMAEAQILSAPLVVFNSCGGYEARCTDWPLLKKKRCWSLRHKSTCPSLFKRCSRHPAVIARFCSCAIPGRPRNPAPRPRNKTRSPSLSLLSDARLPLRPRLRPLILPHGAPCRASGHAGGGIQGRSDQGIVPFRPATCRCCRRSFLPPACHVSVSGSRICMYAIFIGIPLPLARRAQSSLARTEAPVLRLLWREPRLGVSSGQRA